MLETDVALVTGASRGIGRAIALVLGKSGAAVVGTATNADGAEKITAEFAAAGIRGQGMVWVADQPAATEALMAQLDAGPGLPNVLINNAGIARERMLKERHGRIISIGSVVGSIGNAGQVHYAAAKAGLIGFSKALAKELATRNITVTS